MGRLHLFWLHFAVTCCVHVQWVCISAIATDFIINDICWALLHATGAHCSHPAATQAESTALVAVGSAIATFKFVEDHPSTPHRGVDTFTGSAVRGIERSAREPHAAAGVTSPLAAALCSARLVLDYARPVPRQCRGPLSFVTVSPDCRCIATGGPGFTGTLVWHRATAADGHSNALTFVHLPLDETAPGDVIVPSRGDVSVDSEDDEDDILLNAVAPQSPTGHMHRDHSIVPKSKLMSLEWRPITLPPRSVCCGASCSRRKGVTVTTLNVLMGVWSDGQVRLWRETELNSDFGFTMCATWAIIGEDAEVADGTDLAHVRAAPASEHDASSSEHHVSASWVGYGLLTDRLRSSWCTDHLVTPSSYRAGTSSASTPVASGAAAEACDDATATAPLAVTPSLQLWPRHGHIISQPLPVPVADAVGSRRASQRARSVPPSARLGSSVSSTRHRDFVTAVITHASTPQRSKMLLFVVGGALDRPHHTVVSCCLDCSLS